MGKWARWLVRLIGPALLVLFLWRTDWNALLSQFGSIAWWPVVVSMLLMPPFVAIKAWRWNLLMRELDLQAPPLGYSMVLYTIGLFLGGTTPGQSGDFIKAWYLRDRGLPLPPVLFSIVLDRLFDFLIMALLALLTLVVFINLLPESAITATIVFASLIIVLTPLLMARRSREWLMTRTLPFAPRRVRAVVERWRDQFATLSLRPGLLMLLVLASVGSAVATMARIYLLYLALPLGNVPLLAIISSTALIAILQALPISFSGIGVRDAVLIAVLGQYGHNKELAIVLSALFLLLNIEHIIVGFLVSLRYPLGTSPEAMAQIDGAEPSTR
jgi:uncharacterized protein (TIRG00374 family)